MKTQKIVLHKGENWVSINVNPTISSIYKIFKGKPLSYGDIIKSKKHKAHYDNKKGWIGNLKTIEGDNMYIIHVKNPMEIILKGSVVTTKDNIELKVGKNWFNYTHNKKKEIYKILKNMMENDYIIYKKHKIYYKNGKWTQNEHLTHFEDDKGYIIYSQKESTHSLISPLPTTVQTEEREDFVTKSKHYTIYYIILAVVIIFILFLFFRKRSKK